MIYAGLVSVSYGGYSPSPCCLYSWFADGYIGLFHLRELINKSSFALPEPLYGAVEAGGTKFVCALCTGPDDHPGGNTRPRH